MRPSAWARLSDAPTGLDSDTITNAYDYWDGVVYPGGAVGIKHGLRDVIRRNDYEFQAGGSYYWG
jgi:hypothetical protein